MVGIGLVALVGFLSYNHYEFYRPTSIFERLVANPVPDSVRAIEQGHLLAMDSTFWVLRFQISRADLQLVLDGQHFAPVNEKEEFKSWDVKSNNYIPIQKDEYFKMWKERIYQTTKLEVNIAESWIAYSLKEGHGEKRIFFDPNSTEAVFIADAH